MTSVDAEKVDRVRSFYDENAKSNRRFAAVLGESNDFSLAYREFQEWRTFCGVVSIDKDSSLLELGCGGGRWLDALSPSAGDLVGVELSSECAAVARERLKKRTNVSIVESAIQEYQPTREFTHLYYSGVLLYLDDHEVRQCVECHLRAQPKSPTIIIRDSVALEGTHQLLHGEGYSAIYRDIDHWQRLLMQFGYRLTKRAVANAKDLRPAVKNSMFVSHFYTVASWLGLSKFLFRVLAASRVPLRKTSQWPGYSHDFLVFER
jgi:hypothetical protein